MSNRPSNINTSAWPAAPSVGAAFGVVLLLVALATTIAAAWLLLARIVAAQVELATLLVGVMLFLLLLADMAIGYWLFSLLRLRYRVDRNALTIEWGGRTQVIPMPNVVALVPASELDERPTLQRFHGLRWPGYRIGTATTDYIWPLGDYTLVQPEAAVSRELTGSVAIPSPPPQATLPAPEPDSATPLLTGITHAADEPESSKLKTQNSKLTLYTTAPDDRLLYVITAQQVYAISPAHQEQFVAEFKSRHALAPTEAIGENVAAHGLAAHPFWTDGVAQAMLALALIINIALFAYLAVTIPATDRQFLIMHWNAQGQPDRTDPILQVFQLPFFALVTIAISFIFGLYIQRRDLTAARFVYAGAAAVQVVFWAAVVNIISR